MNELEAWMSSEDDEIPWVAEEESKTPFYADKPVMPIEKYLASKGVKHLADLLEAVGM